MLSNKKSLAAISALALTFAPVVAQAATSAAKPVSSKAQRTAPAKKAESKLGGGSGVLIAVAAAAAVVLGIVLLSDDDSPSSP
jgi:hypothetical protein